MKNSETFPHVNVLGVAVAAITLHEATQIILAAVRRRDSGYVAVTGVHGITEAYENADFCEILNGAFLVTPDGMPLSWVGWAQGFHGMDRVYGPDLMAQIFAATTDGSIRHFFYGGHEGVADALKAAMEARFPGVRITGTFCPPFRPLTDEEGRDLARRVIEAGVDILWVGLSTPKQERFMAAYSGRLDAPMLVGVGAAFDFFTGRVKQAPYWMQRSSLEWLYRLIQEPRRLGRRYVRNNPLFALRLLGHFLGVNRRELPRGRSRGANGSSVHKTE